MQHECALHVHYNTYSLNLIPSPSWHIPVWLILEDYKQYGIGRQHTPRAVTEVAEKPQPFTQQSERKPLNRYPCEHVRVENPRARLSWWWNYDVEKSAVVFFLCRRVGSAWERVKISTQNEGTINDSLQVIDSFTTHAVRSLWCLNVKCDLFKLISDTSTNFFTHPEYQNSP